MRRRVLMGLKAEYGEWTISIDVVPSSVANTGGTVRIAARASRQVWWHDGTETVETVEDIPVSVSGLASGDSYVDGLLTVAANSLSSIKTITVSASYEDVSASVSIQQAAKSIASYGEWEVDLSTSVSSVTAAQSTVRLSYSASREVKWTDGSTTRETGVPAIEVSTGSVSDSLWTIPSNTETSDKTHTVTASYGVVNTSKSVLQTKDEISSYGEVNLVAGTINDIPASGGGSMSYGSSATQQITWVSGRKTTAYPSVTEGSMDYDSSKGTTISGRTLIGNVTVSASGQGGKTATKTIAVYQAANLITKVKAGSNSFSYSPIAAGATSAAATSSHSPKYTFSSGAPGTTTPDSKYGTLQTSVSYSIANTTTNGFTAVNSSTGALTATSRGTTYGATSRASATVTKTLKYTWTHSSDYGGSSVNTGDLTKTATCSQDANLITKLELQNASGGALTAPGTYSAAEQTQSVANKTAASCGCKVTFSSTSSSTSYSTWVTLTTTYSWSSNQSYATLTSANASSLNVKMAGRGTTTGDARNATITRQAQFTATLKSGYTSASAVSTTASCTATVIQQANTADASSKITAYGTPSVSIGTGITAGGGSATITRSVSNTRTYYYTSGSAGRTASEAGTVNLAIQSNGNNRFSLSGTTLSHSSMTTNAVTDSCTVRATNAGDSSKYKDATTSVTNAADASSKITTYGPPSVSIGTGITAGGGSATITRSVSNTRTYYYTSGSAGRTASEAGTVNLSIQSNGNNRFSLSGTTLSHSSMTTNAVTDSCTVRATNAGDSSKYKDATTSVTNAADASSKITAYGTPSVSIGTGITAGGGSAAITRSVSNTRTYYYTSGSAGRTASEAGTVNLAIQSNGNNRFSLSGTTLSHSSMTTNIGTDSCTVRATNAGDSSKYKDATTSVTNAKDASFTYGDVTIGTYSYETFDGGATTKDPTLSYSQTRTGKYTSGSTSSTTTITSGATLAYSMTTTSIFTGIVASSGRITSVRRSEAGPAHTTTATVKVTLNGKSATKSTTVTSAENLFVITKVNTVTNSERYTQFPVALNYFMGKTAGDTCQLSGFLRVNISKSMSNGSSGSNGVECVPITDLESYGLTLSILSGSLKNYANVTNAGLVTLSRNISSSTSSGTIVFGISYNGSVLCQLSVKMTFLSSPTKRTQTINWTINGDYSDLVAGNYYGNITRYRLCFLLYMTSSSDDWESTVYGMPYVMHIKTNDAGLKSGTLTVPFTMQSTNTYVYAKMALVNPSGAGSLLTTSSSSVGGGRVMLAQSFTGSQTVSFSYTAG